ncbi:uncharacterized protein V1510DRAFT_119386 [Dipodascopsis tothii]|uniref:uncharacterized protein n=1 Tax=Dipodascopsis tothii TaxID=44089 RepID=UPI0034CDE9C7
MSGYPGAEHLGQSFLSASSRNSTPRETPPPPQRIGMPSVSNIYTAVYSGIAVFEMMVNGVAVMRRRADSYLNATQILKVAGIDKGRRTKILEKEILIGENEKVQGGYGKYQGTWIPYERGREFCRQYSVEDLLQPLLDFDVRTANADQTPTKEQAMAARRKQLYAAGSLGMPPSLPGSMMATPSGSFDAVQAHHAHSMPSQAHHHLPVPPSSAGSTSSMSSQHLMQPGQGPLMFHTRPLARPSYVVEAPDMGPAVAGRTQTQGTDMTGDLTEADEADPKRSRLDQITYDGDTRDGDKHKESTLPPLDESNTATFEQSREILTQIFLSNEVSGVAQLSDLDAIQGLEIDVSIDDAGHSALHWAAALARVQLVQGLVARGAEPRRGNYGGETALVRAVQVTNSLEQGSFPQLLDILYPAITLTDRANRTVLHHIALTAGIRGRSAASRYYLECLLEWIVRRGASTHKSIGLGRFMSEVVNAQDKNGDTSLNIAARIGNKSIVQQLIEVGADPNIANRAGLRPVDFGVGNLTATPVFRHPPGPLVPEAVVQKSKDILSSMGTMLAALDKDFHEELQNKQRTIDTLHTDLREATVKLSEYRRRADTLREQTNRINEIQQRSRNLEQAIAEEENWFKSAEFRESEPAPADSEDTPMADADTTIEAEADPDADRPFRVELVVEEIAPAPEAKKESAPAEAEPKPVEEKPKEPSPANSVAKADEPKPASQPETTAEAPAEAAAEAPKADVPQPDDAPKADEAPKVDSVAADAIKTEATSAADKPAENKPAHAPGTPAESNGLNGDAMDIDAAPPKSPTPIPIKKYSVKGPAPDIPVLKARIAAYKINNTRLNGFAQGLRGRSSDLEEKFRKVVALCTGVHENRIDSLLEGLVQAVQSDPAEVDIARVAGFLRNVESN